MFKELIKKHPYLYQFLYETRIKMQVKRNKVKTIDQMKKKIIELNIKRNGTVPDLENPKRYTDKIHWRKLYGLTPEMSRLSDKYAVREWIKEKIGEEYLIPLLGVWDSFDEIDFNKLPDKFVLKTNNASSTNVIVTDKNSLDLKLLKKKFDFWMKMPYWYLYGYEMQYSKIPPKIIAEKYMEDPEKEEILDYKFRCYMGRAEYVCVDLNRHADHRRAILDRNWMLQDVFLEYPAPDTVPEKPENFEKMLEIADTLAEGFDYVRVDLYDIAGHIYFGEMTFTSSSGLCTIKPEEWNYKLGSLWKLDTTKKKEFDFS